MRFNEKFKDNPEHTSQSYNIHAYSLVKAQEVSDLIRVSNQFIYTFLRKSGESFKDSGATVLLPSLYNHYDQFYTSFLTRAKGLTGIPQDMKDNLKTILQYEYMFSKMVDLEEASEDLSNLIELLTLTEDPDILVLLIRTIAEKIHDSDYTQDWKKQDLQWQIKLLRFMNIFFDFFNQVTFDVLLHDFAVEYKRSIEKRALRSLFGKVESLVLIHKEFITFKNILQRVLNAGENLEENSLTELNTEFRKANGHGKDSKPEAYEISAMLSLLSLANSYSSKRDNKLFNLLLVTERFRVSFNSMESCIPLAKIKQRDQKWPQIAFQCLELLEKKGESQEIPLEYLCLLQDIVPIYKFLLVKSRVSGQIYSICALQAILGLAPKLANQKPFCMRVDSLLDETLIEFMLLLKKSTFVSYDKHIQDIGQNLTKCLLDPTLTHLIGGLALREVASFCSEILSSDQRFTSFLLQQTDCNALFQTHLPQLFEKVNAETPANVRSLHSILKYVTEMLSANSNFESEESKKFFDELKDTRFIKTLPDFLLQPGFQQVLKHSPEIYVQILDFVLAFDNKQNDLFNDERYVKLILQGSKVLQADKNLAAEVVTRSIFGLFDKIYERESLRRFPSIDEAVEDLLISFFSISALNGVSVDELEKHFTLSIKSEDYSENQRKIKAITKVLEIYHSKIETAFKNIQGPEASTSSSGLLGLEALATEIVIGPLRLVQIMIESLYKRHDVATREILDQCKSFLPLVLNILVSPIMMFAPQGFLLAHKKTDHIIDRVQYFIFLSNYLDVNYFTRVVDELKAITTSWPSAAQLKLSNTAHYLTSTSDTSEALIRQFVFSKEEYQFFNFVTLTSAFRDHLYKTQGNDLKLTHLQKDKHWAETLKRYEELLPTFIDLVIAFVMNIYTALATESTQDADSSSKHVVYEKWYGYLQLVWKGLASLSVFSDSEEVYDTTIKIIFQHLLGASQTVGLPPVVLHHLIANACGIPKIAASLKEDIVKVQDEGKTLAGASFFKRTNLNCLANKIEKLDAVLLIGSHVKTFTQDESMEHFDHAILDIESFYQFLSQNDAVYLEFRKTLDYIEELSNLKNKIYSKEQISFISNIQKYLNNIILKQLRKVAPKKEKADFEWSVASKEIELFLADITAKSEESLKASSESSRLLETLSARYLEMSEKNEGLLDWTKLNSLDYPINETILSQALKAFILLSRAIPFKEEIAKALKKEKKDTFSEEYTKLFEKIMHDIRAYLSYTFLQGKTHAQFEKEVISSMRDLVYSNQNNQEFRVIFSQESFLKSIWLLIYNLILISREAANEVIESGLLEALLKKEYTTSVTWETSSFALLIFDIYMSSSLPAKELIELHLKIHFTLKSNQQQNLKELLDSDFLEFAIKSVNQEDLSDVLTNHFKVSFDNDQDPTCDIQSEKASILQSSSIENAGVLDCAIKSLSKTVKKVLDVLINALVANYCSVVAHRESEDYVQSGTKRLTTELLYQLLFIVSKYPHLIPHVFMKEIQTSIIRAEQLPEFYPYTKFQNQDTVLFLDVLLRVVIKQDTAYALPLLDFRRSCGLIAEIVKEGENTRAIDLNHVLQDKFIQLINELIEEELASGRVGGSYSSIETITTAMLYIPFYGAQDIGISNLQFAKSFKTTLSKLLDWLLAMDKKSFDNEAVFSNISLVSDTLTLQATLLNEGEFTPYRDENYLKLLKELEEFKDIGKEDDTVLGHRKIFDNFADKLRNTHNANDRAVEIEGQSEELSKRAKGRLYSVLQDRAHEMGLGFSGFYPENALEHGFTAEKLTLASDAQKSYHENMEGFSFYFLRNPERDTLLQFELPKKLQNPKLSISIKNLPHIQDQFAIKFDSAAFLNKLKERKLSKPPSPQKQDAEENKEQAQEKEESKVPETVEEEEVIPPSQLFEKVMEAAQSEPERYSELLTKILDGNLFEPINSGAITDPVEAKRLVIDVVESLSVEADVKQELIQKVFGSPKKEKAGENEGEESKVPETVEEEQVIPLSQLFERVMEAAQSEPERYSELLTKILDENLFEPINSGTITDPVEAKKLVGDVVESCSVSADVKQDFIKKVFGSPKKEKSGENEEESKAQGDDFIPSQAFDKVMEVVSKYPDKYNEFVNKALDEGLFDQLNGMVDAKEAKEVIKNAAERYIGSSSLREEFLDKLFAKLSKKNTFQNEEAETFLMPKEIFDKYIKSSLGALKKRKLNVTDVKKHWFKKLGDVKRQVKFKIESVLLHLRRSLLTKSQIDKLNSQEIEEIADIKDPVELEYFIKAFYDQAPEYLDETVKERATQAKRTIESIEEFIPQDDDNSRLEHFLERYMSYLEEAKARRENQEGEEEKKDSSEQVIPGTKTELVSSIQSDSHARRSNGGSAIPSITSLQGRPPPKFVLTNHVRFCNEDINYDELKPGKRQFAKEDEKANEKITPEMLEKFTTYLCCTDKQIEGLVEFLYLDYLGAETWKENNDLAKLFLNVCKNPLNEIKLVDTILFLLFHPQIYQENQQSTEFPLKMASDSSLLGLSSPQKVYATFLQNAVYLLKFLIQSQSLRFVYVPMQSIKSFTIKSIHNLKTKYRFNEKNDDISCLFDLILGLSFVPEIKKDKKLMGLIESLFRVILDSVQTLHNKNYSLTVTARHIEFLMTTYGLDEVVKTFEGSPRLFMNIIPSIFEVVLAHLKKDTEKANQISAKLKEIEKVPEDQRDNLLNAIEINVEFADIIKSVYTTVETFFNYLFRSTYLFWNMKEYNDLVDKETFKVIENSLRNIRRELEQEELQLFMLSIYEILDVYARIVGKQNFTYESIQSKTGIVKLVEFAVYLYSIIEMKQRLDQEIAEDDGDAPMPKLSKMVSKDYGEGPQKMSRTFTYIRREKNFDFDVIFTNFGLKYNKILSSMCAARENEPISGLVLLLCERYPFLLNNDTQRTFVKKMYREYFYKGEGPSRRDITITRSRIIETLAERLEGLDRAELARPLRISFENESGIDEGGLTRELYTTLAHELFDPDKGLFRLSGNKLAIQPRPDSAVIPNHLKLFELAGIAIAKAIISDVIVDCNFTKSFLKHILGRKIAIADLSDFDAELAKNAQWTLENEVEGLCLTFSYDTQILGENVTKELIEGGADIEVDDYNKKDYVMKLCEALMTKEINLQLEYFIKGFRAILPSRFLSHLSPTDLALIISGTPTIDLEDMKKNCRFENFEETSDLAKWIWEVMSEFTQEELASFLYFISGSNKVPAGGFQNRQVVFKMLDHLNPEQLPVAHTCFYTLDLPNYVSKDKVREKLLLSLYEGKEGFFIA